MGMVATNGRFILSLSRLVCSLYPSIADRREQRSTVKGMGAMQDGQDDNSVAALRYVREMLPQLKKIVGMPHGTVLPHLLDMARMEVEFEIERRTKPLAGTADQSSSETDPSP
ncbi:hypothetical protein [Fulvimarina sp. 2208YS6-2-32]|nr:hypothetical protein [Fulvimarina sp. 2208YS6-2-32]